MKKKIIVGIVLILIVATISTVVFADAIQDAARKAVSGKGDQQVIAIGSTILGIVQAVGIAVSVIMLAIMAIKFFLQSPGGKAEILQQLKPYVIGVLLIMSGTTVLTIAYNLGNAINAQA